MFVWVLLLSQFDRNVDFTEDKTCEMRCNWEVMGLFLREDIFYDSILDRMEIKYEPTD